MDKPLIFEERICALDDIPDGDSAGFAIEQDGQTVGLMAVRQGDEVFAYVNSCPHVGVPLDFTPGKFLDLSKTYIQCASHGATFRIETGECIGGPCAGKSLTPVTVHIKGSDVYVKVEKNPT